jgi:hypothetical protein
MTRRRSRGIAAIELACVLVLLVPLLVASLYLGRLALAGAALELAATNAARFMATVPNESLHDPARLAAAQAAARAVFDDTLTAAGVEPHGLYVWFSCDPGDCRLLPSGVTPTKVGVYSTFGFPNMDVFYNQPFSGQEYTWLTGYAEVGRER